MRNRKVSWDCAFCWSSRNQMKYQRYNIKSDSDVLYGAGTGGVAEGLFRTTCISRMCSLASSVRRVMEENTLLIFF